MRFNSLASAGKAMLASALLLPLAACDDTAPPVEEETPTADAGIATPDSTGSETNAELIAEAKNDTPVVASVPQPSTTRTPAPSTGKATSAPVATPTPPPTSTTAATPAADPHAGHDMSTMSEEDMKAMGHK